MQGATAAAGLGDGGGLGVLSGEDGRRGRMDPGGEGGTAMDPRRPSGEQRGLERVAEAMARLGNDEAGWIHLGPGEAA